MLAIRSILHPTDFSERSEYAYRLACSLARDYSARLLIVHVCPPAVAVYGDMILAPPAGTDFQEVKDKLLRLQGPDSRVLAEHRLEEGVPAEEILRVAQECKSDLIVMGTHGRRGLRRLLMGSVAEQVMRNAPCPVITVKTPFAESSPIPSSPVEESVTI
jgi:nucleotide-binding universal stress UspA family protein